MSTIPSIPAEGTPPLIGRPLLTTLDTDRGRVGMWLFIATEAALFVILFFAYFYLARGSWRFPIDEPPKLRLAIPMLLLLAASSFVLHWGERHVKALNYSAARTGLLLTIAMGAVFLVLQGLEYADHLKTLRPTSDAYGSIFYTITSFHAAHLILGLLMLGYVAILPAWEPHDRPPHRPYHNASLYWHFVDVVWVLIVGILYVLPNLE